jgi:hypothetical protein
MPATDATGTLAVSGTSVLRLGGHADFDTTVAGLGRGYVYVTVVCVQGATVVYQWSKRPDEVELSFPLVDQAGQGLEWSGGPARGIARLVHRIDGRKPVIRTLAEVQFEVEG